MTRRFEGKVAIVTGAGTGFGSAIAEALADEGADVLVHYRSSADGAEATAARIRDLGRKATTIQGDIGVWEDVQRMAEEAFGAYGHVDVLINNVGDMAVNQMSWRRCPGKHRSHARGGHQRHDADDPRVRPTDARRSAVRGNREHRLPSCSKEVRALRSMPPRNTRSSGFRSRTRTHSPRTSA